MRALVIMGSRNVTGQTAQAADALMRGLINQQVETEQYFLPTMSIERCRQCEDTGWGICREKGSCIISDDFADMVQLIHKSDLVVFATPVYYGDLSESVRAFTDRLRRVCSHPDGKIGIEGKYAVGICVAGGGGGGAPECCVSLKKVLRTCGFNVLDMVPVRRQNLILKTELLEQVGEWLAEV